MRRTTVCLIGAWLVVMALWLGKPAYRSWKEKRAAQRAVLYLGQTNNAKASLSARLALQLNSNCLPACRVMAELADRSGSPSALDWRRRVEHLAPADWANQVALARTALEFQQPELARAALERVPQSVRKAQKGFFEVAGALAFARHELAQAEQHLSEAIQLDPDNPANLFNREILRLHSSDSNRVKAARAELEKLCSGAGLKPINPGLYRAAVQRVLITEALARQELERACSLAQELETFPEALFTDHLLVLQVTAKGRAQGGSEWTPAWAKALSAAERAAGGDAEKACALLHWLAHIGHGSIALEWLTTLSDEMRRETPVRLSQCECYLAAGQRAELPDHLNEQHWAEDDYLRHAVLAYTYRRAEEDSLARIEWKRATRCAGRQGDAQRRLVRLAGAWGWEMEAQELLWAIGREGPSGRWALDLLGQSCILSGRTDALRQVLELAWSVDPGDVVAKNDWAAACLLLRTNLDQAHTQARAVFSQDRVRFASTYAYSLYLQGRLPEALDVLRGLPEDLGRRPNTAAYYGILLAAADRPSEARIYLDLAERGVLLPEECDLVQAARERLTVGGTVSVTAHPARITGQSSKPGIR
jgi:Tfp pilus assembly protein PilF